MGYIIASQVASASGNWHLGVAVAPIFGFPTVLILLAVHDPVRGEAEGIQLSAATTNWWEDIKSLAVK